MSNLFYMPFHNSSTTNCKCKNNTVNPERIISMKTILHKTRSLKPIFLCMGIAVILCGSVNMRHLAADEQAKQGRDFFDKAEPIVMKDPLAVVLGAMGRGTCLPTPIQMPLNLPAILVRRLQAPINLPNWR